MRDLTIFEGAGIGAIVILLALMASRRGVKGEDLALYLGSGCLFEIVPTMVWGFIITVIHYEIFTLPIITTDPSIGFQNYVFILELVVNGIFSILSMITAAFVLGKSAGVGFISSVALGYYTYWLAMM